MNYPRPVLTARNGVRLDLSRSVTVDRDIADALDLDAIETETARNPAFLAALLSLVERYRPAVLPAAPFNSSASPTVTPSSSTESVRSGEADSISSLLESLRLHRDQVLYWVTLTTPNDPKQYLGDLLSLTPGAWGVLEARRDGSLHAHALVLLRGPEAAVELLERWSALSGGKPNGQNARQVSGWRSFAVRHDPASLARNLSRIVDYASKQPVEAFAVGALAGVPMLSRSAAIPSPTVTARLCLCGCGQATVGRSQYAAGDAHRQRVSRRARVSRQPVTVSGDTASTVTPVTPERDIAPTVTTQSQGERLDLIRAASTVLEGLCPTQAEDHAQLRAEREALIAPYISTAFWAVDFEGALAPTEVLVSAMAAWLPRPTDPRVLQEALSDVLSSMRLADKYAMAGSDDWRQLITMAGGFEPNA